MSGVRAAERMPRGERLRLQGTVLVRRESRRNADDRAQTKPVAMDIYNLIGARPATARQQGPEIIVGGRGALVITDANPARVAPGAIHVEAK